MQHIEARAVAARGDLVMIEVKDSTLHHAAERREDGRCLRRRVGGGVPCRRVGRLANKFLAGTALFLMSRLPCPIHTFSPISQFRCHLADGRYLAAHPLAAERTPGHKSLATILP